MPKPNFAWKDTLSQAVNFLQVLPAQLSKKNFSIKALLIAFGTILLAQLLLWISMQWGYYQTAEKQSLQKLETLANEQASQLNNEILQAQRGVERLKGAVQWILEKTPNPDVRNSFLQNWMTDNLRQSGNVMSFYIALEKETSKQYFEKNAVLNILYKDAPRNRQSESKKFHYKSWFDGNYLSNEREVRYHLSKENDKIQFSPFYFDKNYLRESIMTVSQSFFSAGKFQGVIGTDILADNLFADIQKHRIGNTGGMALFDNQTGLLLTETVSEHNANDVIPAKNLLGQRNRMQYNVFSTTQQKTWQDILKQAVTHPQFNGDDGKRYILISRPLKYANLTLLIFQQDSELYAMENIDGYFGWVVVIFILGIAIIALMYVQVEKPLLDLSKILAQGPVQVESGEWVWEFPQQGTLEIKTMSDELHQMLALQLMQAKEMMAREEENIAELKECQQQSISQIAALDKTKERLKETEASLHHYKALVQKYDKYIQQTKADVQKLKAFAQKAKVDSAMYRQKADDANQTRNRFLANMSHELRTPMNAIIGYTEILQEDADEFGYLELVPDLQKIHGASFHMLDLINNLFDLSKIESSRMDLYLETFDLVPILQDIATTVQPLVEHQGNILKLNLEGALGTMTADLAKIRQMLMNLLNNAGRFSKQGVITLSAQRQKHHQIDWIILKVSDEGIGMSVEQVQQLRLFFADLKDSGGQVYTQKVGLTLTMQFCRLMGGTFDVESHSGEGTTFIMQIPADVSLLQLTN
jgi:signal transduction histidine kinase